MKKLMVTADDGGLSQYINHAIIEAHRYGIVTGVSVLMWHKYAEHLCSLVKHYPELDTGVHLCITQAKPILPSQKVSTLIADNGNFYPKTSRFLIKLVKQKISLQQVEAEFSAQIEKALELGLKISHIDTHQHIHLYTPVLEIVVRLAKKYNIPYVRNIDELLTLKALPWMVMRPGFIKKLLVKVFLPGMESRLRSLGLKTNHYFIGYYRAGKINKSYLCYALNNLKPGLTELCVHISKKQENFRDMFPGSYPSYNWQQEFEAVVDPVIMDLIKSGKIFLVKRSDL